MGGASAKPANYSAVERQCALWHQDASHSVYFPESEMVLE